MQYAKATEGAYRVQQQDTYNAVVGEIATGWMDKFNKNELTEDDVFNTPDTDIPMEHRQAFAQVKDDWVSRIRMRNDRKMTAQSVLTTEQEKAEKKRIEGLYNVNVLSDLEVKAKAAESPQDVMRVKQMAIDAENKYEIKPEDTKRIFGYADTSFKDAPHEVVKKQAGYLRDVKVNNRDAASLTAWLQAQVMADKAQNKKTDVTSAMNAYSNVTEARKWLIMNYEAELNAMVQPDKNKPALSVSEMREIALEKGKAIERMSDIDAVRLYKENLSK
jgi:hypothetical protein